MRIGKLSARYSFVGIAILLGVLVSACVPIRLEASWPALSIVQGTGDVLLTYNDRIVRVNPEDGQLIRLRNADGEVRLDEEGNPRVWEFTGTDGQARQFYSAPLQINDETLLVATYNSHIMYEVDLPTARIIDSTEVNLPGQILAGLVQNDDTLYVGISERNMLALDRATFDQSWMFETEQGVWSGPVIVDGTLFFASLDHHVYALDAETGDQKWQLDLEGAVASTPLYHEGHLYVGSFARKIFDVDENGEILAQYPTEQWVWGSPTIVDNVLYATDLGGNVYALDTSDGGFSEIWQRKVADRGIRATPVVTDDYVIIGSRDHKIYWLDRATGETIQDEATVENVQNFRVRELAGEILSNMLLIEPSETVDIPEPYLIVSSVANQELLVAFKVSNGERVWSYGR